MALTEKSIISRIEILEAGQIQIQRANIVLRDGIEIARQFHRHALVPGQDTSTEDDRVKAVAAVVWTPEVVSSFKAKYPSRL